VRITRAAGDGELNGGAADPTCGAVDEQASDPDLRWA